MEWYMVALLLGLVGWTLLAVLIGWLVDGASQLGRSF
jgi:hypothetical protein